MKALDNLLQQVISDLIENNIAPHKIILFGSYNNGNVHKYSDVDIAVWSDRFSGNPLEDFNLVKAIAQKNRPVSFKLYPADATANNYDPFIEVIEQTGKTIYEQERQTR